jgi:L-threonylcarbamoyladenylate synthase
MSETITESQARTIEAATHALMAGGLVAIPTETVYGLAGDASNEIAVAQIFALKGRPSTRPLIVHIASADQLEHWASTVPDYAQQWAKTFWPGPLTLILPKQPWVLDAVTGGQHTVALRVPNHPLTLALLQRFGGGLAAPSANRYGRISPTCPDHVRAEFTDHAPLILEGGSCPVGIESTIVSCLDNEPKVLRPGAITAQELADSAGIPVGYGDTEAGIVVPGQVASHYAPVTRTCLVSRDQLGSAAGDYDNIGFMGFSAPPFATSHQVLLEKNPQAAAQQFYAGLRALDAAGVERIIIEAPPEDLPWLALWDRLRRATA